MSEFLDRLSFLALGAVITALVQGLITPWIKAWRIRISERSARITLTKLQDQRQLIQEVAKEPIKLLLETGVGTYYVLSALAHGLQVLLASGGLVLIGWTARLNNEFEGGWFLTAPILLVIILFGGAIMMGLLRGAVQRNGKILSQALDPESVQMIDSQIAKLQKRLR